MQENEQNTPGKAMSGYAKYMGMAVQMIVVIGGMTYAGYKIDEAAGNKTQWVTIGMALAGVFISLYLVIRATKE